jgi:dipeptidyl aminopeptidase/acylaminoacyl peptidase
VIEKFMSGPPGLVRLPEYRMASPTSYVSEKIPPLLLIYGEADEQVNVNDADRFVAALSGAGQKNVSYFRLAGVGHCPHSLVRVPYLQQVVEDFFLQALKSAEGGNR